MNAIGSLAAGVGRGVVKLFTPVAKGAVGAAVLCAPILFYENGADDSRQMKIYGMFIAAGAFAGAVRATANGIQSLVGRTTPIQPHLDTADQNLLRFATIALLGAIVGRMWALSYCRNNPSDFSGYLPRDRCIHYIPVPVAIGSAFIAGSLDIAYPILDFTCLVIGKGIATITQAR
jgi:hypothetical protein